ncbi:MAG: hypothetical protein GXY33_14930 [Phycisphaerae bacterium]|mgnify:FL=1|nr:hypothetical protein [Phycisphaerae bacterium]
MARKSDKKSKKDRSNGPTISERLAGGWRWLTGDGDQPPSRWARMVRFTMVAGAAVWLAIVGMRQLDKYVRTLPDFTSTQVVVSFHEQPPWMMKSLATEILEDAKAPIYEELKAVHRNGQDHLLAELFAQQLSHSGWIQHVHWVRRSARGQMVAQCDFRRPVAAVAVDGWRYLIDERAVVLPGRYPVEVIANSGLMEIRGCPSSPPNQGMVWQSPDLAVALEMVQLLESRPYRQQVKAVDVANYKGRLDPMACWIVLLTDRDTVIRWGLPPRTERGLEITWQQKLEQLAKIYRDHGHIDYGRAFIDVRPSTNYVHAAIASSGAAQE